jgi:Lrp/AsnC family transcriptional regulator
VIKRRIVLLDPLKLGLRLTVFVSIEVDNRAAKALARFAAEIVAMEDGMTVYRMAGDVDYVLRVVVPARGLRRFLQTLGRDNAAQQGYVTLRLANIKSEAAYSIDCRCQSRAQASEHRFAKRLARCPPDSGHNRLIAI